MPSNPLISIIIPVYGVEKYIAKCIESIKAQTFSDFEAILINDGTKDNSVAVAEQAIAGDERFIILHKENGGQGSARNLGLDNARGEYIAFIDSDDWVADKYLEIMLEKIKESDADICICQAIMIDKKGNFIKKVSSDVNRYYNKNDILLTQSKITNFMWDKLYKKSCFNDLRFNEEMKSNEDVDLLFRVVYGKKMINVAESLYFYLQREKSTLKGVNESFISDRLCIYKSHVNFLSFLNPAQRNNISIDYSYLFVFVFSCALTINLYSKEF